MFYKISRLKPYDNSADQRSTTSLNRIDFRKVNGLSSEAQWEFVAVEELALGRSNGTERVAGEGTQSTVCYFRTTERAMLLSLLSVGGERGGRGFLTGGEICGQLVRRGGWVNVGRMVD